MNKYLILRIAFGAAVLGGVGFGLYKLYETKKEPKQVIDISHKYKKPVEEEPEAIEPEVVEEDETVSQGTNSEPTVTIEPEEEEDDDGYDTYNEYDDHGWS